MTRHRFGGFTVDTDTVEVIGPDGVRAVEPQVFDVLLYLIRHRDRVVTKAELLDNVWGDRFVSESALTTRIKQARRAIGDDGTTQWAIKTVHGRGYRFVPEVGRRPATVPTPTRGRIRRRRLRRCPTNCRSTPASCSAVVSPELRQCLEVAGCASVDGPIGWIWILGEPGIGKTRLAAEVARHARDRGHCVLFGRNGEDLKVPYQPFIEVIRQNRRRTTDDTAAGRSRAAPARITALPRRSRNPSDGRRSTTRRGAIGCSRRSRTGSVELRRRPRSP